MSPVDPVKIVILGAGQIDSWTDADSSFIFPFDENVCLSAPAEVVAGEIVINANVIVFHVLVVPTLNCEIVKL